MQLTMPRVVAPRALPILAVIALVIAAFVVAALIVGSQQRLPPPFGLARTGMLIYESNGDIFARGPDGRIQPLLADPEPQSAPTWARDGSRFAFWSGPFGATGELKVADASGTNVATLVADLTLPPVFMPQSASWSPDGRMLAFSSGDGVLEVINADGTGRKVLGEGPLRRFDPAWSPDGQLIAFRGQATPSHDASRQVYVIRPNGTGEQQVSGLSIEPNSAMAPSWSVDGRLLYDAVFDRSIGGNHGDIVIATATADGWTEEIIVGGPTSDWLPRWSNDGTRIVFLRSFVDGEGDLFVTDADGSDARKLSDRAMSTAGACWTPDDTAIAALTGQEGLPINSQEAATYILFEADTGRILEEIRAPGVQGILDCSWQRLAP